MGRFGWFAIHECKAIAYLPHLLFCAMTENISAVNDFPPSATEPCKFWDKFKKPQLPLLQHHQFPLVREDVKHQCHTQRLSTHKILTLNAEKMEKNLLINFASVLTCYHSYSSIHGTDDNENCAITDIVKFAVRISFKKGASALSNTQFLCVYVLLTSRQRNRIAATK